MNIQPDNNFPTSIYDCNSTLTNVDLNGIIDTINIIINGLNNLPDIPDSIPNSSDISNLQELIALLNIRIPNNLNDLSNLLSNLGNRLNELEGTNYNNGILVKKNSGINGLTPSTKATPGNDTTILVWNNDNGDGTIKYITPLDLKNYLDTNNQGGNLGSGENPGDLQTVVGATILSDSENPGSNIGNNGDLYINTASGEYFIKENGSWDKKGSLRLPVINIKGNLNNTNLLPLSGNQLNDGYVINNHLWVYTGRFVNGTVNGFEDIGAVTESSNVNISLDNLTDVTGLTNDDYAGNYVLTFNKGSNNSHSYTLTPVSLLNLSSNIIAPDFKGFKTTTNPNDNEYNSGDYFIYNNTDNNSDQYNGYVYVYDGTSWSSAGRLVSSITNSGGSGSRIYICTIDDPLVAGPSDFELNNGLPNIGDICIDSKGRIWVYNTNWNNTGVSIKGTKGTDGTNGTNGTNGHNAVEYSLQCSPNSINFRSDSNGNINGTILITCVVMKTDGNNTPSIVSKNGGKYDNLYLGYRNLTQNLQYSWITNNPETCNVNSSTVTSNYINGVEFALSTTNDMSNIVVRTTVPVGRDGLNITVSSVNYTTDSYTNDPSYLSGWSPSFPSNITKGLYLYTKITLSDGSSFYTTAYLGLDGQGGALTPTSSDNEKYLLVFSYTDGENNTVYDTHYENLNVRVGTYVSGLNNLNVYNNPLPKKGELYYDTNIKKLCIGYPDNKRWIDKDGWTVIRVVNGKWQNYCKHKGNTSEMPFNEDLDPSRDIGYPFYNTDINKMLYLKSITPKDFYPGNSDSTVEYLYYIWIDNYGKTCGFSLCNSSVNLRFEYAYDFNGDIKDYLKFHIYSADTNNPITINFTFDSNTSSYVGLFDFTSEGIYMPNDDASISLFNITDGADLSNILVLKTNTNNPTFNWYTFSSSNISTGESITDDNNYKLYTRSYTFKLLTSTENVSSNFLVIKEKYKKRQTSQ